MNHRMVEPEKVLESTLSVLSNMVVTSYMWLCKLKSKLLINK